MSLAEQPTLLETPIHEHVDSVFDAETHTEATLLQFELWGSHSFKSLDPEVIRGGSVIQLRYFEFDAMLCYHQEKVTMEDFSRGTNNYSNLAVLENLQQSYSTKTLWVIENMPGVFPAGGLIQDGRGVLLRHFQTGLYLTADLETKELGMTTDWLKPEALFALDDPEDTEASGLFYSGRSKLMLSVYPSGEDIVGTHLEDGGVGLRIAGGDADAFHPSKLFMIHLFDATKLELIREADNNLATAKDFLRALQTSAEGPMKTHTMAHLAPEMIICWAEMIKRMDQSIDSNPFTRDGIPKPDEQLVLVQQGGIDITISVLHMILSKDIFGPKWTSGGHGCAITLLFRFLKQAVKQNQMAAYVLEPHLDFLLEHLNSSYRVNPNPYHSHDGILQ